MKQFKVYLKMDWAGGFEGFGGTMIRYDSLFAEGDSIEELMRGLVVTTYRVGSKSMSDPLTYSMLSDKLLSKVEALVEQEYLNQLLPRGVRCLK